MDEYCVRPLCVHEFSLDVPASKSILNRALVLAAFTEGDTLLLCGEISEDSRTMLACLAALGVKIEKIPEGFLVHGTRKLPQNSAIDVGEAGTAARFLTALLAFRGGDHLIDASAQMRARPMDLTPIEGCGVTFEYLKEKGRLPFRIHSDGIRAERLVCDTSVSTQFASGLMLAAATGERPATVELKGEGANSPYLEMTASLIRSFGGKCSREGDAFHIHPAGKKPAIYYVEPDVSAACYFFALSLLCRARVTVRGVTRRSIQGDIRFLRLLEERGVGIVETEEGLTADGREVKSYCGFSEDLTDYADQAPTVAALAVYAASPTRLSGLARSRYKESDRLDAIKKNMLLLGVPCFSDGDTLSLSPAPLRKCAVDPCGDHRIAMAFAVAALKEGGVAIRDPACCSKTFENFFRIIDRLTGGDFMHKVNESKHPQK